MRLAASSWKALCSLWPLWWKKQSIAEAAHAKINALSQIKIVMSRSALCVLCGEKNKASPRRRTPKVALKNIIMSPVPGRMLVFDFAIIISRLRRFGIYFIAERRALSSHGDRGNEIKQFTWMDKIDRIKNIFLSYSIDLLWNVEEDALSQIKIVMSRSASDETLAFLQTKSNILQKVVPDDVRGDEEALRFFLSLRCRLCVLCGGK